MNIQTDMAPNYVAIKAKQNAAWTSGDYAVVGTTLQIVGEALAETLNLVPGSKVLDVAAGNGNATLAFARRWHAVTSTDYVEDLLAKGQQRATAEGLDVMFQRADAEDLPFANDSFDGVVSTFGVMFAPNQAQAASELLRVCKPGGKVGMANWTPESFIGQLFKTLGGFVAPPAGVKSPALWGNEEWLNATFASASVIQQESKYFNFRYRDADHFIDIFRTLYGPVHKAFLSLNTEKQVELRLAIEALIHEFNAETDGSVLIPGEYAEVVITK